MCDHQLMRCGSATETPTVNSLRPDEAMNTIAMQEAIIEGVMGPDHFSQLSQRLEQQLQLEVYKDALAEVRLIKHNVIQAFLESSGDPTVVHNLVIMVCLVAAATHCLQMQVVVQSFSGNLSVHCRMWKRNPNRMHRIRRSPSDPLSTDQWRHRSSVEKMTA